jgi:alkaline phosphatase D
MTSILYNSFPTVSNILSGFLVIISFYGCRSQMSNEGKYESNFNSTESQTWIGPEFWSNPLQDWQIQNGRLECLVSNKNRNVHLLTEKLDSVTGELRMRVDLQLLNLDSSGQGSNWVGFSIGSRGNFNDYRDDAIFGKGLNVGITTNGNLFIEEII